LAAKRAYKPNSYGKSGGIIERKTKMQNLFEGVDYELTFAEFSVCLMCPFNRAIAGMNKVISNRGISFVVLSKTINDKVVGGVKTR